MGEKVLNHQKDLQKVSYNYRMSLISLNDSHIIIIKFFEQNKYTERSPLKLCL